VARATRGKEWVVSRNVAPTRRGPLGFLSGLSDQRVVALVYTVAMFMDIMDGTIVNTALPAIGKDFGTASPSSLAWVVLGYLLSLAIWIPASGWLGDRFGTKKVFLFALFVFTAASMLCGFSHSLGELSAYRFIQGIGGGMMTPVGLAMLYRAYPAAERAKIGAILVIPTLLAPALGPVLGGFLTDGVGWRWIFFVNAPFGLAMLAFGTWRLTEYAHESAGKFDPAGFFLSASALACILYALNQAPLDGWTSRTVMGFGISGLTLGVILVIVENHVAEPLLALRLFRSHIFRASNITSVFMTASFFGLVLLMPLMLQTVRGDSAWQSGLTTFPQALGVMLMSQVVRKLYPKIGPRRLVMGGLTMAGLVMLSLEFTTVTTSPWAYRSMLFARGLCWAFVFIPLQAAAFCEVGPLDTGRASALYSAQRQVASSLGVGILISMLVTQLAHARAHIACGPLGTHCATTLRAALYSAYRGPFLWCALFAFMGALSAWWIDDKKVFAVLRPNVAK